jgi:hypothetical protein
LVRLQGVGPLSVPAFTLGILGASKYPASLRQRQDWGEHEAGSAFLPHDQGLGGTLIIRLWLRLYINDYHRKTVRFENQALDQGLSAK